MFDHCEVDPVRLTGLSIPVISTMASDMKLNTIDSAYSELAGNILFFRALYLRFTVSKVSDKIVGNLSYMRILLFHLYSKLPGVSDNRVFSTCGLIISNGTCVPYVWNVCTSHIQLHIHCVLSSSFSFLFVFF